MYKAKEVKTVLNKTKKRDAWFLDDYTLNLYSGCSYNCLFCYIRGSKYGEHMEKTMTYKSNALELLEKQLHSRAKRGQFGFIVLSSATDPYLQAEKELNLTRGALELILKYKFPVHVITRSDLILRDIDLLLKIKQTALLPIDLQSRLKGVIISFSFSTLKDEVARIFEPGGISPSLRLKVVKEIKRNDFKTGISLMPLLPFISDTGPCLEEYFSVFSGMGLDYVMPSSITIFGNENGSSRALVFRAIAKHFPELLPKYEKLLGKNDYLPSYYNRAFSNKMKELANKYQMSNRITRGII